MTPFTDMLPQRRWRRFCDASGQWWMARYAGAHQWRVYRSKGWKYAPEPGFVTAAPNASCLAIFRAYRRERAD